MLYVGRGERGECCMRWESKEVVIYWEKGDERGFICWERRENVKCGERGCYMLGERMLYVGREERGGVICQLGEESGDVICWERGCYMLGDRVLYVGREDVMC